MSAVMPYTRTHRKAEVGVGDVRLAIDAIQREATVGALNELVSERLRDVKDPTKLGLIQIAAREVTFDVVGETCADDLVTLQYPMSEGAAKQAMELEGELRPDRKGAAWYDAEAEEICLYVVNWGGGGTYARIAIERDEHGPALGEVNYPEEEGSWYGEAGWVRPESGEIYWVHDGDNDDFRVAGELFCDDPVRDELSEEDLCLLEHYVAMESDYFDAPKQEIAADIADLIEEGIKARLKGWGE